MKICANLQRVMNVRTGLLVITTGDLKLNFVNNLIISMTFYSRQAIERNEFIYFNLLLQYL